MDITKDTYQSFLTSVLEKVPTERRDAIKTVFADETVAPILRDAVLARADYSRQTQEFNREVAEARAQIGEWQQWYQTEVEAANQRQAQLDQYRELYGELDEDGQMRQKPNQPAAFDLKQLDNRYVTPDVIAQRDAYAMQFADILTDLKIDHQARYGQKLDGQALMDHARRSGVSIRDAYRQVVEPLETARAEKELGEKLARAKEEGRQQALTDHKLPMTAPRREPHYLDQGTVRVADSRTRVTNAVAAFNAGMAGR
jgi:hypothetical protein